MLIEVDIVWAHFLHKAILSPLLVIIALCFHPMSSGSQWSFRGL